MLGYGDEGAEKSLHQIISFLKVAQKSNIFYYLKAVSENREFSQSFSDELTMSCWFIGTDALLVFTHSESLSKCV